MNYNRNSKIKELIKKALTEDIGKGDITVKLFIPKAKKVHAVIRASSKGIICGTNVARLVFKSLDGNVRFITQVKDGDYVKNGQIIANIYGKATGILTGERTALNFLGLLSGIATRTREFVRKIKGYDVKIMDTRKTLPGLRELQKYAVRIGGGYNHRFRLDEMILLKDNHLTVSCAKHRSLWNRDMVKLIKQKKPKNIKVEIEVKNLKEVREAIKLGPDIVMFDNMRVEDIKKAIRFKREYMRKHRTTHKMLLEASGSVNIKNVRAFAQLGVDVISLGTLTKDIQCLDLSLEIINDN